MKRDNMSSLITLVKLERSEETEKMLLELLDSEEEEEDPENQELKVPPPMHLPLNPNKQQQPNDSVNRYD